MTIEKNNNLEEKTGKPLKEDPTEEVSTEEVSAEEAPAEGDPAEEDPAEEDPSEEVSSEGESSNFDFIIGKKIGMTRLFNNAGINIPVTVIEAGPCPIVQVKTIEKDGYSAFQLGFLIRKKTRKPIEGHFNKANLKFKLVPLFSLE